jgi:hypothetical protein
MVFATACQAHMAGTKSARHAIFMMVSMGDLVSSVRASAARLGISSVDPLTDVGDQVTAAENFLRDRGVKPGMGLMDPTVQSMPVPPAGTMLATPEMVVPLERLPTRSTTRWWIIASALRNSSDLDSRGCSYCYPLSKMLACPESQQDLWWHGSD